MKTIFYSCISLLLFSCNENVKPIAENKVDSPVANTASVAVTPAENTYSVKTYTVSGGWGYDIFVNEKLYIHQPAIPAIAGNKSFVSEDEAVEVANIMISKIKNNIMPPAVTVDELDSLGVKYHD